MKKNILTVLTILLALCLCFTACGKPAAPMPDPVQPEGGEEAAGAEQAGAPEGAIDGGTFWVVVPEGWAYDEERSKNSGIMKIVYPGENGEFSYTDNDPYWNLEATDTWNNASPEGLADAPIKWAETPKEINNGSELVEMTVDGQTVWMTSYPNPQSPELMTYRFTGTSEIKQSTTGSGSIYYDIELELANCPADFYDEAAKLLDNITFNFTYDFE